MVTIHFLPKEDVPMEQLKYAVIVAKYHGRWIFCRHKKRNTWEVPGGHREPNEIPYETARRELDESSTKKQVLRNILYTKCVFTV